jgi:uncharacterized protein
MQFKRKILDTLLQWKNRKEKKPLILRGARQVGKTTLVNQLGTYYENYIYLNLEKRNDAKFFTAYGDDVLTILNAIALEKNTKIILGNTLIFIDEIQQVPKAIQLLRYFYEEAKYIDVIAAGSLLEFSFSDVESFPVGRVELLKIYPLSFEEFLMAQNLEQALSFYQTIPIPSFAHNTLLAIFNEYIMVGGMPEVVKQFIENKKNISAIQNYYSAIWDNYTLDVEKYGKNSNEKKIINHIIHTAAFVRDRISFNGFGASNYKSREVSEAFAKLQKAGLFTLIYPTTQTQTPLNPNFKRKPKLQFLDTGILNYAANLQTQLMSLENINSFYKGFIVNHIAFQELIANEQQPYTTPLFWTREETNANAEVDIIIPYQSYAIPVEVKAGAKGSLKSLHEFMDRCNHTLSIRLLANTYSKETSRTKSGKLFTIINLPYYCAGKLQQWIEFNSNDLQLKQ